MVGPVTLGSVVRQNATEERVMEEAAHHSWKERTEGGKESVASVSLSRIHCQS